jgi:hypothetical protein
MEHKNYAPPYSHQSFNKDLEGDIIIL